tara:strand:+ start:1731 stop:2135 length:405 start_codon:yes stop_codon:yes gene_type:complete
MITVNEDLTSTVVTADGLLECNLPNINPETQAPFSSESEVITFVNTKVFANPNYFSRKRSDEEKAQIAYNYAAVEVRGKREQLLKESVDIINAVRWASMTEEQQGVLATYRQALLDITAQEGFPNDITWPTQPE